MRQIVRFFATPVLALALFAGASLPAAAQQNDPVAGFKEYLKITPAQENAWKNFAAVQSAKPPTPPTMSLEQFNAMNTPARIAFIKKRDGELEAFFSRRFDATLALYGALDDAQKKLFDDATADRAPQQPAAAAPGKAPAKAKKK